jgi:hypothetical protein
VYCSTLSVLGRTFGSGSAAWWSQLTATDTSIAGVHAQAGCALPHWCVGGRPGLRINDS